MQPSIAPLRGTVPRLWEENHDFYHSSWKSMRLLVHLDLGASEVAPLRSHPQRLQARISMRAPCPDGLRSPAEAEPLFALEDLLSSHLRREVGALYVGRIIGGGELTLVWYMPSTVEMAEELETLSEALSETLSTLVSELAGGYQIRLSQTHDPAWSFYFDFLFPDVYNLQVMLNRRRLLVLEDHGDDGARPRQVDHQARFPTLEQAEAARRALSALGYEVDDPELDPELDPETDPETDPELPQLLGSGLRSGLRSGSGSGLRSGPTVGRSPVLGASMSACGDCCTRGERNSRGDSGVGGGCDLGGGVPWLLTFGRWDSLSDGRIDTICTELLDAVLPLSGHYEGWGAEIGSGLGCPP